MAASTSGASGSIRGSGSARRWRTTWSDLGRPIVVGTSRKTFIGRLTGREVDGRLGGSIASNVLAARSGAQMLRVHDVREMRDALKVTEAVLSPS